MVDRPQRDYRDAKKDDRLIVLYRKVTDLMATPLDQGEINISIKYHNGGICSATAEVKNTVIL